MSPLIYCLTCRRPSCHVKPTSASPALGPCFPRSQKTNSHKRCGQWERLLKSMSNQISAVGRQLVAPYFDVSQGEGGRGREGGSSKDAEWKWRCRPFLHPARPSAPDSITRLSSETSLCLIFPIQNMDGKSPQQMVKVSRRSQLVGSGPKICSR